MIHQRQVLALFGALLPLSIVGESKWWSIPVVALVMFALYGTEAIASQLEDPFGYDRNDIKMDDIVEDARTELGVMLDEWRRWVGFGCVDGAGDGGGGNRRGSGIVKGREMFIEEI